MKKVTFGLVLLLLSGCSSTSTRLYEGSQLPENEIVRLSGKSTVDGFAIVVCEVNRKKLSPCAKNLELLPGKYSLATCNNLSRFHLSIIVCNFEF
jgi:hypothetical protein